MKTAPFRIKHLTVFSLLFGFASTPAWAIIGGDLVVNSDPIAQSTVVLLGTMAPGYSPGRTGPIVMQCTASLIAEDLAVTAGHCVAGKGSLTLVFVTDLHSDADPAIVTREVDVSHYHENYLDSALKEKDQNDIALVHFKGGLVAGYQIAKTLPTSVPLKNEMKVTVAGYGESDRKFVNSTANITSNGILHKAELSIAQLDFSKVEVLLDQSQGKAVCTGDSGGPAYVKSGDTLLLWGVAGRRYPHGDTNCDKQIVFTKLGPYTAWIEKTAADLRNGKLRR